MNPIIEKKRSSEGEFFVNLFEWCNLSCPFCWQDHNKWDGVDSVVDRAFDIVKFVLSDNRKHFIINLMGGELFADEIKDQTFEDYFILVKKIIELWPNGSKTFEVNWVTNLVYENTSRVEDLINKLKELNVPTKLTTSFDFSGRFSVKTKQIFEKNIYKLRPLIGTVSVVLTAPNIRSFLNSRDPLFDKLYEDGFYFYFDYYSPEKNFQKMAPSDSLLQEGLLYLLKNYPNVWPIAGWIQNERNEMSCRSSVVIDNTGFKGHCRALLVDGMDKKFSTPVDLSSNKNMENAFVDKYKCIECEYYHRCGMGCFLQHDFKGREEMPECLYKGVFRQIDELS